MNLIQHSHVINEQIDKAEYYFSKPELDDGDKKKLINKLLKMLQCWYQFGLTNL